MAGNDASTPNSALNSWSLQVVPNSIILETPASDLDDSKLFNSSDNNSFVNKNRFRNVQMKSINFEEQDWDASTPITFIPKN